MKPFKNLKKSGNLGNIVCGVSILILFASFILFLVDVIRFDLYKKSLIFYFIGAIILAIVLYRVTNHKNKLRTFVDIFTSLSIIGLTICIGFLFVKALLKDWILGLLIIIGSVLLIMVDNWVFDEKPWYFKERSHKKTIKNNDDTRFNESFTFRGSYDELPNPYEFRNGDIIIVKDKPILNEDGTIDENWKQTYSKYILSREIGRKIFILVETNIDPNE